MAEEKWIYPNTIGRYIGAVPKHGISGVEYAEDICPGWAVRQPMIEEIAQAFTAFKSNALESAFPDAADCLIEGVLETSRSFATYEQMRMAVIEAEQKDK